MLHPTTLVIHKQAVIAPNHKFGSPQTGSPVFLLQVKILLIQKQELLYTLYMLLYHSLVFHWVPEFRDISQLHTRTYLFVHRRRINMYSTEEKAKVVSAADGGTKFVQFHAALAILH